MCEVEEYVAVIPRAGCIVRTRLSDWEKFQVISRRILFNLWFA